MAVAWLLPVVVGWNHGSDLGHSWAVPILMGYLWWERWGERPVVVPRPALGWVWWLLALVAGAVALPLRLLLTPFPLWPVPLAAFTGLVAAVALLAGWLAGGRAAVRWLGGPLLLLISALPAPTLVQTHVIMPLRESMAALAAEASNLFGYPAIAYGTSVRLANGWVGVDEACGGIRSLQACVMIGLFFGEWFRFGVLRRLGLVGIGVLAALVGNFGRVLFLSFRAHAGAAGVETAHDAAGWLAMLTSLIITGWLACRWAGFRWPAQRRITRAETAGNCAVAWLGLVVVLLALNEGMTRWWFSHGASTQADLPRWTVRLPERHWSYRAEPLGTVAREMLQPDEFIAGHWQTPEGQNAAAYYIEWRKGQVARSIPFLHNPVVCMPAGGCELVDTLAPLRVPWAGGEIPFLAYKFRQMGEERLVVFTIWDSARARPLERADRIRSLHEWWQLQWTEVREARQHQPAQLLTLSFPWADRARADVLHFLENAIVPVPARDPG